MLVNLFVFGFQGVLVGVTWARRRGYPAFLQILFGVMLLGAGILPMLGLAILGMLDTWWDFRRLGPRDGGTAPAPADGTSGGSPESKPGGNRQAAPPARPAGRPTKVVHER